MGISRHELSQTLAEGSQYKNLRTTSRSGASKNLTGIQQLRHERDHLTFHVRNLETETPGCRNAVGPLEAQVSQILRFRGMVDVESQKSNAPQADVLGLRANNCGSKEEAAQLANASSLQ